MATFAETAVYIFPLATSGRPTSWFHYEGIEAITNYQQIVLKGSSQIRMLDQHFYERANDEPTSLNPRAITSRARASGLRQRLHFQIRRPQGAI